jgi:AcrR family transcriptional regulator
MGRWEPNARGRLGQAALDLYIERGFEQTTTAEIARRAGLTERTFFRHFADKREVLFGGQGVLVEAMVSAVASSPETAAPIESVVGALETVGAAFFNRRDYSRQRQAVIDSNPELRERELIKLASLASAIADTLRGRGVDDRPANLAAEAGITVFKVAFERWISDAGEAEWSDLIREAFQELKAVTAGT